MIMIYGLMILIMNECMNDDDDDFDFDNYYCAFDDM